MLWGGAPVRLWDGNLWDGNLWDGNLQSLWDGNLQPLRGTARPSR